MCLLCISPLLDFNKGIDSMEVGFNPTKWKRRESDRLNKGFHAIKKR